MAGEPKQSPYPDWRTHTGEVTFSRAFDRYWCQGWEDANDKCKSEAQDIRSEME